MIHIVTAANADLYRDQIEEMFRLRHEFYVERNGWRELDRGDGLERDEFDGEHTVYMLCLDGDDRLLGSYRLCPTLGPNLLFDKFGDWIDDRKAARSADVWDLSRWFITDRARHGGPEGVERDAVQAELSCGIFEFALSRGLKSYVLISEMQFYTLMLHVGWPVTPLGLPRPYDAAGHSAIAVKLDTTRETLELIRGLNEVGWPVTYEAPPPARLSDPRALREAAQLLGAFGGLRDRDQRTRLIRAATTRPLGERHI